MNPAAVEHMTQVAGGWGRVVWMSTFDAENQVRYSKENRPFVRVSRDGELLPETRAVISVIAKHGLVLATGHVSAREALMLLREGRRQGVQHMVVTHAINAPILMDVEQMQEAAKLGAYIEFAGSTLANAGAAARIDRFAEAIRKVGPEFCILSSDLGQKGNPLPPDGFGEFLAAMLTRGFTEQEVSRMSREPGAAPRSPLTAAATDEADVRPPGIPWIADWPSPGRGDRQERQGRGVRRDAMKTTTFMKEARALYASLGSSPVEPYYTLPESFRRIAVFMQMNPGAPGEPRRSP